MAKEVSPSKQPPAKPDATPPSDPVAADANLTESLNHIEAVAAAWPDLITLTDVERKTSVGRLVARDAVPLGKLFTVIGASRLRAAFDALGDKDGGDDPDRFEVELLQEKLRKVAVLNILSDALRALADKVDDTILREGEGVVVPGLMALELARTLAKHNTPFRGQVAEILNEFSTLTAQARRARDAASSSESEPKPADTKADPQTDPA